MKAAVIGIGSNSVRALLAEAEGESLRREWRDREGTRLFAGLDSEGNLSGESIRRAAAAVGRMAEEARKRGAEQVDVFATSAARDAANGECFIREIARAAGTEPVIISGEEEASLSFYGASEASKQPGRCGVIDIGGGSTEIVTGEGEKIDCAFSCQMGAVRLYQAIQLERREDMVIAEQAAAEILREKMEETGGFRNPGNWIGTGGTFTTLAAMVKKIPWTDRTCMHGTQVSREEIRRIGEQLADMDLEERKKLPGLQPGRADIVVHGICILLAVMTHLEIGEITVSEWGNMDGYLRRKLCGGKEN
ncbi:MAG: Ppx/GppA family phosphatase [Clostridiales bacterium]|nr:Ppx/GppA family phosphatase [Clostridiales bacterium]